MPEESEFLKRLRAAKGRGVPTPPPPQQQPEFDEDLIPDPGGTERPEEDIDLDRKLKEFPIEAAYRRWINKGSPKMSGRADSNMVRCPRPDHEDMDPSAWFNVNLNTGTCAKCPPSPGSRARQWGFDPFDLFAIHEGFNVDTYKHDGSFPTVRRRMAEDLGYQVARTASGQEIVRHQPPVEDSVDDEQDISYTEASTNVVQLHEEVEDEEEEVNPFSGQAIDWRALLDDESTFLRQWMELTTHEDDLPEEFYFWLGLVAIGLACGNDLKLLDKRPVRGNLLVCLVGVPGLGKSNSVDALIQLIERALPFTPDQRNRGVRRIPVPGSGDGLVKAFVAQDKDTEEFFGVRGLTYIDELATLAAKSSADGSTLKQAIQDMFDRDTATSVTVTRGEVIAKDHFSTVVSSTQPKLISRLLSKEDVHSGFLSRWVFVTGVPKEPIPIGGSVLDVEPLVKPLRDIWTFAGTKRLIYMDDDAKALYESFYHRELLKLKRSADSTIYARVDLLVKKLVLLFAADKQKAYVGAKTMHQVMALWPYLKKIYGLVDVEVTSRADVIERTDIEDRVTRAIEAINRKGKLYATKSNIRAHLSRNGKGHLMKLGGNEGIERAIATLFKSEAIHGDIPPWKPGPGRPPTTVAYWVPDGTRPKWVDDLTARPQGQTTRKKM